MIASQKEILVYVSHRSWRCWRTKRLLRRKGYYFTVVDTTGDSRLRSWLVNFTGRETLPYVFVDRRPVGGLDEVMALERSDRLDRLVRGAV